MADRIVLLKDGLIVQQGSPNELYNHPADEFVASFLGTPQINIFSCDVRQENGWLVLDGGAFRIRAPQSAQASLKAYAGRKVNLGIRPSDFELVQEGADAIPVQVDSIEPLGDAYRLALIEPGQPVFIVVPGPDSPHSLHDKVVSNIQEIRARGARTLVIAEDGDEAVGRRPGA